VNQEEFQEQEKEIVIIFHSNRQVERLGKVIVGRKVLQGRNASQLLKQRQNELWYWPGVLERQLEEILLGQASNPEK